MNEHRNDAERTNSCIFSILSRIVFKKLYFTYYSLLSQVFTVSVAEHIDVVFLEKLALNDQALLVSDWSIVPDGSCSISPLVMIRVSSPHTGIPDRIVFELYQLVNIRNI